MPLKHRLASHSKRSRLSRMRSYYRMFRCQSGPVRSLYFAISLAI